MDGAQWLHTGGGVRVAFAMIKTKTQAVTSTHFPENRTFFGLKIHQLEAE